MSEEQDDTWSHPDRNYQIDNVLTLVSQLYETYYRIDSNVTRHRLDTEIALEALMNMWNRFLG